MITVNLIRSGTHSKYYHARNMNLEGKFIMKFKSIEDLVLYMRSNHCGVYFYPNDSGLTPEQYALFRSKYKAMIGKMYPSIDKKIQKEVNRLKLKYKWLI